MQYTCHNKEVENQLISQQRTERFLRDLGKFYGFIAVFNMICRHEKIPIPLTLWLLFRNIFVASTLSALNDRIYGVNRVQREMEIRELDRGKC